MFDEKSKLGSAKNEYIKKVKEVLRGYGREYTYLPRNFLVATQKFLGTGLATETVVCVDRQSVRSQHTKLLFIPRS